MPSTIIYRPELVDQLVTPARLGSYQAVFAPANDIELMGVYLWNSYVCGTIYPLIGSAEIALRNSVDTALRANFGTFWWSKHNLRYRSYTAVVAGGNTPKPVDNLMNNFIKATKAMIGEHHAKYGTPYNKIAPDHNKIVAKTDFSTWQYVLDQEFMDKGLFWPHHLSKVFQGPWGTPNAGPFLQQMHDLVKVVREFRNRLSHHEPAWKRHSVATEADAVTHLQEKIAKIEDLIRFVHPEKLRLLERHGLVGDAKRASSSDEISRFKQLAKTHKIDSIRRLHDLAKDAGRDNRVLRAAIRNQGFIITPR